MPKEIVEEIDRRANNRSKFVLDAVRRELDRRRSEDLRRSLENPHEESEAVADLGMDDWGAGIAESKDAGDLLDPQGGREVRWRAGLGWTTPDED